MKTTLTLFAVVCLTFQMFGQYARSIYSDDSQARRHNSLFSINGETTIVSLRESENDILRVMLIDIDEDGETSNYRMYEYSPFTVSSAFALSGVGVNSAGEVTLCVLNQISGGNNSMGVKYITLDPNSGTFSNESSLSGQYKPGFTRTRVKGDSLITYLGNFNTSGISRVARSLSNSGFSTELVASSGTYSGTLFQNQVACELIVDGNNEYIATSNRILKRSSAGNYIDSNYYGVLNPPSLTINSFGELFVLKSNTGDFSVLDANLIAFNSGNIPELQGNLNRQTEMYSLPNNDIRVWTNRGNESLVMDITPNYTVVNKKPTRSTPLDQFIREGKQYVIGYDQDYTSFVDVDGTTFQNQVSNITVVSDDLSSSVSDFIEFDQVISTDKIRFHTNHASRSFTNLANLSAGFSFEQNGFFRSLIYTSVSNMLGSSVNGALLGTTGNYSSSSTVGPYCDPGSYGLEVMDKYNRGYYVTREMIEQHLFEITIASPYYEMPFGIREWPAHGDVSLGQAANLAGFVDQNGNGTYEPELGDYPSIYGDQCLLNVYHQNPETPNSASIETHQYYFTFDCDSSKAIENAVFVRTHNFARTQMLVDTYAGDYIDFDVGSPFDDYSGTNVELSMVYGYNGDQFDENGIALGFQDTIPAVGMMTLQGLKLDNDGVDNATILPGGPAPNGIGFNDGIVDNEFYTMEASYSFDQTGIALPNLGDWRTIMQGYDANGSPKTVNGVDVRHDYFGNSDPAFYTSDGIDHGNNHSEAGLANPTWRAQNLSIIRSKHLRNSRHLGVIECICCWSRYSELISRQQRGSIV